MGALHMSQPTTEAGKRLLADCLTWARTGAPGPGPLGASILAIEAEARAAVLREVFDEIDVLPDTGGAVPMFSKGDVLEAILRRLEADDA
jgi:hypothetical protein